jgi:hypothetical protein
MNAANGDGASIHYSDDSARTQRYNITMLSSINRRLARLEVRRPKRVSGPLVEFSRLSAEVQALWLAVDGDMNLLSSAELDVLEAELRRLL